MSMEKFLRECRFTGGSASSDMKPKGEMSGKRSSMPSESLSRGRAQAVKSGVNASAMAKGRAMGRSPGPNPAREIAKGAADARRYATGGHISNRDIGMKELAEAQSRNEKLNRVGHKAGGHAKGREHHFWGSLASALAPMAVQGLGNLFGLKEGGQPPMGPSGRRNPNVMYKEGGEPKKRGGSAKREHHFGGGFGGMGMMHPKINLAALSKANPMGNRPPPFMSDTKWGANGGIEHLKEGGEPVPKKRGGRASPRTHRSTGGDFWDGFKKGFGGVMGGVGHLFGLAEGGQPPRRNRGGNVSATSMVKKLHSPLEKEPQLKALGATKRSVQEGEPRRYRARGGSMKAMYEKLHGHQATEPQMKLLGATKANTREGLPRRIR